MKWEYKFLRAPTRHLNSNDFLPSFRNYGKKGWELITVADGVAYFKRPLTEDPFAIKVGHITEALTE